MTNHKFPIEIGRYNNVDYAERYCHICRSDLGDEYHYLLVCPFFSNVRRKYIPTYYFSRPNTIKYKELLTCTNVKLMTKLALFVKYLIRNVSPPV